MHVRRHLGAAVAALAGSALLLAACRGCSSESAPGSESEDAGSDVDARRDALTDPKREPDANEQTQDSQPDAVTEHEGVPPGWQAWTGWSAACPVYLPGAGAELPPPIEWEPCPAPVASGLACKRMKNTWGGTVSLFNRLWRDPGSGTVLLAFARSASTNGIQLVPFIIAEVEGKVRHAQLYPLSYVPSDCDYFSQDFNDGLYVRHAPARQNVAPDGATATVEGAIGGSMSTAAPSVLLETAENSDWRLSKDWLVQLTLGRVIAWTWDTKASQNVYWAGTDPNGLQPHVPIVRGRDIFFTVGNLQLCGVMSWSPDAGLRPLLRWYGDMTRGAGNFGTDGKDMVWTQSQGTGACLNDGPNPEVWTAPYTTDPAVLQATSHRLRKDIRGMSPDNFAVGSGYAARSDFFGTPAASGLLIVRLADGYSWTIPGVGDQEKFLYWGQPLGFTDEELFVVAGTADMTGTVFRIRLDSLGPGTPPD